MKAGQPEEEVLRIVSVGASIQPGFFNKKLLVGTVWVPELEGDRVREGGDRRMWSC